MSSQINKRMGFNEWLLLILLSVIWSGSFFFIKIILTELQPFTIVLGRVSIGAIVLLLAVRVAGYKMPSDLKVWGSFLFLGLINNLIPFSLISWGQTQISSSLTSILNATTPVWTVLLAHFLTKDEKLSRNSLGGVIFGLFGVVIMIGWDALGGLGINTLAQLAIIGAAISYGFAVIYGKRFKDTPPLVTAAGQFIGTTIMAFPITMIIDKPWLYPMPGLKVWAAMLGLALLCTALAYIIYFRLLTTAGAINLSLVTFLVPVGAILLGTIILGEQLLLRHIFGMIMIGFGLAAIDGRALSLFKRKDFQQ